MARSRPRPSADDMLTALLQRIAASGDPLMAPRARRFLAEDDDDPLTDLQRRATAAGHPLMSPWPERMLAEREKRLAGGGKRRRGGGPRPATNDNPLADLLRKAAACDDKVVAAWARRLLADGEGERAGDARALGLGRARAQGQGCDPSPEEGPRR